MTKLISNFFSDETGATAIEYAFIALLVAIGLVTSLTNLKNALSNTFNNVATGLSN